MKLNQLSVFLENKPGHLRQICRTLADAGINIVTLSLADTQQFGILRLIIKEWEQAKEVLEKSGAVVKVTEVVAIEIEDRPGGLADLLDIISEVNTNIEYMYAFTFGKRDKAIMVFRFDNPDDAIEKLKEKDVNVLGEVDIFS